MKSEYAKQLVEKYLQKEQEPEEEKRQIGEAEKRLFMKAVSEYNKIGEILSSGGNAKLAVKKMQEIINLAEEVTISETEGWFDNVAVSRNMKQIKDAYKIFEKTCNEYAVLQQRAQAVYEEIGGVLNRYYDIQ